MSDSQPIPRWTEDCVTRLELSPLLLEAIAESLAFDERFYLATYPDVAKAGIKPLDHYLGYGRFEKRRASAFFDPVAYAEINPEVAKSGIEAFLHYVLVGRRAGALLSNAEAIPPRPALTRQLISGMKRLIVFLTPGSENPSWGVLSIVAMYEESLRLSEIHNAKVALCSVPGDDPLFVKYTWFDNDNDILDLNAILRRCETLEFMQLHIPEYAVGHMVGWLESTASSLLEKVQRLHLNVMVQNIDLVNAKDVAKLKQFGEVTATTAHDAYSNASTQRTLRVQLHHLSVRFGPELFKRTPYTSKKNTLIVSHDPHPMKERVLERIARARPDLKIRIVEGLSYENYKLLASDTKWALTFGEGLDAYFTETILSGGNSFAVFNDRFFTPAFASLRTVYPSWDVLLDQMPLDLTVLDDPLIYDRHHREAYDLLSSLYSFDRFRANLRNFYRGEYTLSSSINATHDPAMVSSSQTS